MFNLFNLFSGVVWGRSWRGGFWGCFGGALVAFWEVFRIKTEERKQIKQIIIVFLARIVLNRSLGLSHLTDLIAIAGLYSGAETPRTDVTP